MKQVSTRMGIGVGVVLGVCALLGLTNVARAAQAQAKVGQPAPQFELKDVVTGKTIKLSDYKGKTVVMTFQSINCPWDRMRPSAGYQRVLAPMSQKWAEKDVVFLAINSNKTESVEQLASYHTEHNLPYPILKDPGNKVADLYGGRTTPHIFIMKNDEAQTLVYKGGIEKAPRAPQDCGQVEEQYLEPVLGALLAGQPLPYTETVSKGCTIARE